MKMKELGQMYPVTLDSCWKPWKNVSWCLEYLLKKANFIINNAYLLSHLLSYLSNFFPLCLSTCKKKYLSGRKHLSGWAVYRLLLLSHFSRVRLCATPETRLPRPWDSPGKNTGVGCHFPLQCMKVKSESEVTQSCPTPSDLMDCSLPGSSAHGIFQATVLEWVAIAFSGK